jgi:inward rectifier potassium channel
LRIGVPPRPLTDDLYHHFMTASWRAVFASILAAYLGTNALFALFYAVSGGIENARPGNFEDAYFFSVQTMATIGYGRMVPTSTTANAAVAFEALFGLVSLALATGLMFAKFSQPRARVIFSRFAVVNVRDGVKSLMVRLANERTTGLVEAQLRIVFVRDERTVEGEPVRRFHTLPLTRSSNAVFALSWTAVHPIDEASPLYGETAESLEASHANVVASLIGIEEATAQTVHVRHSWDPEEVLFGHRFADILVFREDGRRALDYTRFHDVVKAPGSP